MATDWQVTAQRQTDVLTPQGTFETVMEVNFQTIPEGITGQVVIPLRVYEADYVATQIDNRVAAIKAVQQL
jgi:hypothetical protein